MTLIAIYNNDGCVGRCDSRCYDAKREKCTCCCGGKNHRAGLSQAVENVREKATEIVRTAEECGKMVVLPYKQEDLGLAFE